MRVGVVVVCALIVGHVAVARADAPTLLVTCAAGECTTESNIPPAPSVHLVVRVIATKGLTPHVHTAGRDVALTRCTRIANAYCIDVAWSDTATLWFDGHAVLVALRVHRAPFSDVDSARAIASSLYELHKDLGEEVNALNGEGRGPFPRVTPGPEPQPLPPPLQFGGAGPSPGTRHEPPIALETSAGKIALVPEPPATSPIPRIYLTPLPIDDDAYPDVVAVGNAYALGCSGVAVTRRWVLTARHCGAATHVVVANDVNKPAVDMPVDARAVPPDEHLDLELLRTASDLPITAHDRRHVSDAGPPDSDLRVLGFGISNFSKASGYGVKRLFETTLESWGCDGSRPRTTGCDPARELVIPAESGHDTCNGDSGGAVFEFVQPSDEWRLVAITSRAANVLESGCGKGGIYVRIDPAASWIDEVVKGQ